MIDVRRGGEFAGGRIKSATLLPLNELNRRQAESNRQFRLSASARVASGAGEASDGVSPLIAERWLTKRVNPLVATVRVRGMPRPGDGAPGLRVWRTRLLSFGADVEAADPEQTGMSVSLREQAGLAHAGCPPRSESCLARRRFPQRSRFKRAPPLKTRRRSLRPQFLHRADECAKGSTVTGRSHGIN